MRKTEKTLPVSSIAPPVGIDYTTRDRRVARLKSADECRVFITNAIERGRSDLARQALEFALQFDRDFGRRRDDSRIVSTLSGQESQNQSIRSRSTLIRTWRKVNKGGFLRRVERSQNRAVSHQGATDGDLRRPYALLESGVAGVAESSANDPVSPPRRCGATVAA